MDVNSLNRLPGAALALNEIGRVVFTAHRADLFDAYRKNRATGCFILIDALSNNTVAAGIIIDREPSDRLPSRVEVPPALREPLRRRESRVTGEERRHRRARSR